MIDNDIKRKLDSLTQRVLQVQFEKSETKKLLSDKGNLNQLHSVTTSLNINDSGKQVIAYSKARYPDPAPDLDLLATQGVYSPFILQVLYHDEANTRISTLANGDLSRYTIDSSYSLNPSQLKSVIGQIVLAVAALHEKNIVHRDINPANLLYTMRDGKIHVQLADLDGLLLLNQEGKAPDDTLFTGTLDYHSPAQLSNFYEIVRVQDEVYARLDFLDSDADKEEAILAGITEKKPYLDLYCKDLKANDIYALGQTIFELVRITKDYLCGEPDPDLEGLYSSMKNEDTETRISIQQIKQHPYFTKEVTSQESQVNQRKLVVNSENTDTEDSDSELIAPTQIPNEPARGDFLQNLKRNFKRELIVDTYYLKNTPGINDPFYVLPNEIKTLYQSVSCLESKINGMNALLEQPASKNSTQENLLKSLTVTKSNGNQALAAIDAALETNISYKKELTELRSAVREKVNILNLLIEKNIQVSVNFPVLLQKIKGAIDNYITTNKLQDHWFTFHSFNFHGGAGKARADTLLKIIMSIEAETKETGNETKGKTMLLKAVAATLTNGDGGNSEHSLNTFLQKVASLQNIRNTLRNGPPLPEIDEQPSHSYLKFARGSGRR